MAPDWPDVDCIRRIARAVRELKSRGHEVLVVVGGGRPAREYIEIAEKFEATKSFRHQIGIEATRLNARLLIAALGDLSEQTPPTAFETAIRAMLRGKVPIMGGTTPGHTTDAVAAMLARSSNSELLIYFTDVDGVYTADPKLDPKAKKFERITTSELVKLVGEKVEPGMRTILDPVGARLIERARINALVLGKHEIARLPEIVSGGKHSGTEISPR